MRIKYLLATALFLLAIINGGATTVPSQTPDNEIESEMNLELRTPIVSPKLHDYVVQEIRRIGETLLRRQYNIETMRQREVLIVTIPTDGIFYPNESRLYPAGEQMLAQFKSYSTPDRRFKLVIAVHSDDTGSEEYLFDLTEARINAILDYYDAQGVLLDDIIGFAKGETEPIVSNDSRVNRSKNRRIEIYIVPNDGLINEARQNTKK